MQRHEPTIVDQRRSRKKNALVTFQPGFAPVDDGLRIRIGQICGGPSTPSDPKYERTSRTGRSSNRRPPINATAARATNPHLANMLAICPESLHTVSPATAGENRMCFSATASFIASGVIGAVGVATLRHVREPRALLFASVPMLFAVHQFTEGWVWLGLDGRIGKLALDHVAFLFMLYAQGILPLLMPAAVALMEPPGWRRGAILALTGIGALVCVWDVSGLIFLPSRCYVDQNSIAYRNHMTGNFWISCLYVLATCGALLLSTHRVVRWYGAINVVALTITEIVKQYAFASVWCFYAAIMSVIIYWQFRRLKIDVEAPNGNSPIHRPLLLSILRLTKAGGTRTD